jgi:hypothetical protein
VCVQKQLKLEERACIGASKVTGAADYAVGAKAVSDSKMWLIVGGEHTSHQFTTAVHTDFVENTLEVVLYGSRPRPRLRNGESVPGFC